MIFGDGVGASLVCACEGVVLRQCFFPSFAFSLSPGRNTVFVPFERIVCRIASMWFNYKDGRRLALGTTWCKVTVFCKVVPDFASDSVYDT